MSVAKTATDLSIITYDSNSAQMTHVSHINELPNYQDESKISWINISGLKDIDALRQLEKLYTIHPLSIEDVLYTEHQPKMEIFEHYRFLSIKTIQQEVGEFMIDQISLIIMDNTVITFQEIPGDSFDSIRKKILENTGKIRSAGTDYLVYEIIDAVVDEYFLILNHLEDDIENIEERAIKTSDDKYIEEIQNTKKYLLQIKRAITPLKDNIAVIIRQDKFFSTTELKPFLQDLLDNLNNSMITVENYREWLSNIMDVNLSVLSHQLNKVMKVLTVISTIFIPLTFIAGIYGMNFIFMPELQQKLGYPIVLGVMGLIAAIMLIIFKIRHLF